MYVKLHVCICNVIIIINTLLHTYDPDIYLYECIQINTVQYKYIKNILYNIMYVRLFTLPMEQFSHLLPATVLHVIVPAI
jgi:hypothetical protein